MHNFSAKDGDYILTRASYRGHTEIVEALLKANANLNVQNNVRYFSYEVACTT